MISQFQGTISPIGSSIANQLGFLVYIYVRDFYSLRVCTIMPSNNYTCPHLTREELSGKEVRRQGTSHIKL